MRAVVRFVLAVVVMGAVAIGWRMASIDPALPEWKRWAIGAAIVAIGAFLAVEGDNL